MGPLRGITWVDKLFQMSTTTCGLVLGYVWLFLYPGGCHHPLPYPIPIHLIYDTCDNV